MSRLDQIASQQPIPLPGDVPMDIELARLGDRRNQSHVGGNLVATSETPGIVDGGSIGTGHDRPDTRNGHQPSRHFGLGGLPDELLSYLLGRLERLPPDGYQRLEHRPEKRVLLSGKLLDPGRELRLGDLTNLDPMGSQEAADPCACAKAV